MKIFSLIIFLNCYLFSVDHAVVFDNKFFVSSADSSLCLPVSSVPLNSFFYEGTNLNNIYSFKTRYYNNCGGSSFIGKDGFLLWHYTELFSCSTSTKFVSPTNTCVTSCPAGSDANSSTHICNIILLSNYDNNPYECRKHGGFPDWSITNPSGVSVFNSAFRMEVKHHCLDKTQMAESTLNMVLGVGGGLSNLGGHGGNPDILGKFIYRGLDKLKSLYDDVLNKLRPEKDLMVGLPRIGQNGAIDVEIIEHEIPKGSDGVTPDRAPEVDIDAYNAFLRDEFFPKNPNLSASALDPHISQANLDSFSKTNQIFKDNNIDPLTYTFKPNQSNIWKSTNGTPKVDQLLDYPYLVADPVYAPKTNVTLTSTAPIFRVAPVDSTFYPPVMTKVADIPVITTVTYPIVNSRPVKQWENTRIYPDGSTSLETTQIDETYKTGAHTITTVSPDGATTTTSETFTIPNYTQNSNDPATFDVGKTSPISTTTLTPTNVTNPYNVTPLDPITGYPAPVTTVTPATSTTPSTATGQDLINAPMPSYSFPALSEFVAFDLSPVSAMVTGVDVMFGNIGNQLSSATSAFDDTKALINGGWEPPVIPSGSCGDALAFDFHGKHIDLCPPLVNSTAKASPIVEPMVAIGGTIIGVTIFFGGF